MVVNNVQRTISMAAPVPLAMLVVDELVFDVLPATAGPLQRLFVVDGLLEVKPP